MLYLFLQGLGFNTGSEDDKDAWLHVFQVNDVIAVRNLAAGLDPIYYIESKDNCNAILEYTEQNYLEWLAYPGGGDLSSSFDDIDIGEPYGILTSQSIFESEVQTSEYVISGEEYYLYIDGLDFDPKNYYGDIDTSIDTMFNVNPTEFCGVDVEGVFGTYNLEPIEHLTSTYEPLAGMCPRLERGYVITRDGYTPTSTLTLLVRQHLNMGYTNTFFNGLTAFDINGLQGPDVTLENKERIEGWILEEFFLCNNPVLRYTGNLFFDNGDTNHTSHGDEIRVVVEEDGSYDLSSLSGFLNSGDNLPLGPFNYQLRSIRTDENGNIISSSNLGEYYFDGVSCELLIDDSNQFIGMPCAPTVFVTHADGVSIYRDGKRVTGSANILRFGDVIPQDIESYSYFNDGAELAIPYIPCSDIN